MPPAARLLIAGLALPAVLLAGCDTADTTAAGPPTPTPTAKRPTRTPTASRPAPANTQSPSRTPTPAANTTEASRAPARTLATLREIRSVPDHVNPYDCTPPAPERPEVIADVALGGYRPAELIVTLEYNGDPAGGRYTGTARMQYDAARKVFAYRLPPVSRDNLPPHARSIALNVRIDPAGDGPPPFGGYLPVFGECVHLRNGSQ